MKLETQLDIFLAQTRDNRRWLQNRKARIYVRVAGRYFGGDKADKCLDLSSFEVNEEYQSQGIAKAFIEHALSVCPFRYVFVENVLNPRFREYFEKNPRWQRYHRWSEDEPCYCHQKW